ncbi:unnamed protein product [Peniophora sp. CBMAI 1063]|nr:unnamed protein product [Peniophora sp. CBMAI 1063]
MKTFIRSETGNFELDPAQYRQSWSCRTCFGLDVTALAVSYCSIAGAERRVARYIASQFLAKEKIKVVSKFKRELAGRVVLPNSHVHVALSASLLSRLALKADTGMCLAMKKKRSETMLAIHSNKINQFLS